MRFYSKEELSVIFGVSRATINDWIDENRFVGISRENKDQINGLTLWASHSKSFTIGEVHEMYHKNQERLRGGSHDKD